MSDTLATAPDDGSRDDTQFYDPMAASLVLEAGTASDVGGREENEDAVAFGNGLFAVSDGIGGAPYGREASRTACTAAIDAYAQGDCGIGEAFQAANSAVVTLKHWLGSPKTGATLMLASRHNRNDLLRVVWAGDCTCLLLRDDDLQEVAKADRLAGNSLASAVGYYERQGFKHTEVHLMPGDRILLCTDGVRYAGEWSGETDEQALARIERGLSVSSDNPSWVAELVVRDALGVAGPGADNSTALVVFVEEGNPYEEPSADLDATSRTPSLTPTIE